MCDGGKSLLPMILELWSCIVSSRLQVIVVKTKIDHHPIQPSIVRAQCNSDMSKTRGASEIDVSSAWRLGIEGALKVVCL